MIGGQVAKIIASRNERYPVGAYVAGSFGWRTHTVCNPNKPPNMGFLPLYLLPDISPHPVSLALGVLGMPGNTAYFGLKEICKPRPGETIMVTGAAGAVGSHVGQIGKLLGCRVIGFAGSDEKCEYLEKELGFDHAFNYKTVDIKTAIREAAPNRVDCYFDNVGGEISSTIMSYMNKYGRVAVCGSISSYNDAVLPKVTILQPAIVFKELKVEGFLVNRWTDRWNEGINANLAWLQEDFQKEVWNKLLELPYGSTTTYAELAKALGRPASHARAIGAACGANLHLMVIPCHRVVASCSKGGFSCGLDRKEWLLKHEKKYSSVD
ncbi:unnamed protein product, partial [Iphiclides podalirius]